jgi:hypothetical protein
MEKNLLFIAKIYSMFIFIVENQWLKHLVIDQNPLIAFPNKMQMV